MCRWAGARADPRDPCSLPGGRPGTSGLSPGEKRVPPGTARHILGQAWLPGPVPVPGLVVTFLFPGVALQAGGMRPAGRWTSGRSASTWTRCRSATFSVPSQSLRPRVCPRQCRYVAHGVCVPPSPPCSAPPGTSLSPSLGGAGEGLGAPSASYPRPVPSLQNVFPGFCISRPSLCRRAGRVQNAPSSTSPRGRAARCAARTVPTTTWSPAATSRTRRSCGGCSRSRRASCSTSR